MANFTLTQIRRGSMKPPLQVMEISSNGMTITLNDDMELATLQAQGDRLVYNGDMMPEHHLVIHDVIDNIIKGNPDMFVLVAEMNHDTCIKFSYDDTAQIEYFTLTGNTRPVGITIAGLSIQMTHKELCEILNVIKDHWLMSRDEIARDAAIENDL